MQFLLFTPKSRLLLTVSLLIMGLGPLVAAAAFSPVKLTDQFQREIVIKTAPRRIVSGSPGNTEILFALGLGPKIVGVTNWCDYPKPAQTIAKIGDISPLNVEKILALHPDLVVADILNGKDAVTRLADFGIPALALNANSFDQILDSISLIGRATGENNAARNLNTHLQDTLAKVRHRGLSIKKRHVTVYVILGWEPNWTAGPGSFLDEAVTLAGAENIAHDLKTPWGQLSTELVLKRNPGVIITDINPAKIYADPVLNKIAAVRKRQVYQIVSNVYYRPGPRLIEALEDLTGKLEKCK